MRVVAASLLASFAISAQAAKPVLLECYGTLPLSFEANEGQADPTVNFLARGKGYTLSLTPNEATLALRHVGDREHLQSVVRMKLVNANPKAQAFSADPLPGKVNYFLGKDPTKWRTSLPTYSKVKYQNVYDGVDLVYYGNQGQLEYDFVIAPGADPRRIELALEGAKELRVAENGELVLQVEGGEIHFHKPVIYQLSDGQRQTVDGGYKIVGNNHVRFTVAAYDSKKPLIVDPVLVYASYLDGNDIDVPGSIAVDALGSAYVTGHTASTNFPSTPGSGGPSGDIATFGDAFVTKVSPDGTSLDYSTYLGGDFSDVGVAIAVDVNGNAYVMGLTQSTNFPTTPGAIRATTSFLGDQDAFVTKLNTNGSVLVYSTYLGGSGLEVSGAPYIGGIAVDSGGNAFVTAATASGDFPTTPSAYQTNLNTSFLFGSFVAKLGPAGTNLVYSTFLNGAGGALTAGIAVGTNGNAYVAGTTDAADFPVTPGAFQTNRHGSVDLFISKLNPNGSALVFSTYLGGTGFQSIGGMGIDPAGNVYVTGSTDATNFPKTAGAFAADPSGAFVSKLDRSGSSLAYSAVLLTADDGSAIAVDTNAYAYVLGETTSANLPVTTNAFQLTYAGSGDAFVMKVNPTGTSLVYCTYLGGTGTETTAGNGGIAVDRAGSAYVVGVTQSGGFPVTVGAFQTTPGADSDDSFVAKILSTNDVPVPTGPDLTFAVGATSITCTNTSKGVVCSIGGTFSFQNSGVEYGTATCTLTSTCKVKPGKPTSCKLAGLFDLTSFNLGNTPSAFVGLYLSFDTILDGGDARLLKKEVSTTELQALFDKQKPFKIKAKVAKGVDLSGKYILVVIDTTGTVAETDETNNVAAFGPIP